MEGKEHDLAAVSNTVLGVTATTYEGSTFIDNNYTASTSCLHICQSLLSHQISCYISVADPDLKLSKGASFLLRFLFFCPSAYDQFSNLLQDGLTETCQPLIENLKSCLITCKPISSVYIN